MFWKKLICKGPGRSCIDFCIVLQCRPVKNIYDGWTSVRVCCQDTLWYSDLSNKVPSFTFSFSLCFKCKFTSILLEVLSSSVIACVNICTITMNKSAGFSFACYVLFRTVGSFLFSSLFSGVIFISHLYHNDFWFELSIGSVYMYTCKGSVVCDVKIYQKNQ